MYVRLQYRQTQRMDFSEPTHTTRKYKQNFKKTHKIFGDLKRLAYTKPLLPRN